MMDYVPDLNDLSEDDNEENEDEIINETILIIGDLHFQYNHFIEGEELIEKLIKIAKEKNPQSIILLGDILDTHDTAKCGPWKQACHLINSLSKITMVFVIMGNHDMINNSQFLTDNHFFGPLKRWNNVYIVDTPTLYKFNNKDITMIPYVPCGKFINALDVMKKECTVIDTDNSISKGKYNWKKSNVIFAHQEFKGSIFPNKGDDWDVNFPKIISGHIHQSGWINKNIFYAGSSRQVCFDEIDDKKVWILSFEEKDLLLNDIDLKLKSKKEITIKYEDIKNFDMSVCNDYYIKLRIKGTKEQFKSFRRGKLYQKFLDNKIKIYLDRIDDDIPLFVVEPNQKNSFKEVMTNIIEKRNPEISNIWKEILEKI